MALKGDTVRLEVQFQSYTGTPVDPSNRKLNIYNKHNKLIESIDLTDDDRFEVGNYMYDYTLPYGYDSIIYEFFGTYEGKPILARERIGVKFSY